MSKMKQSQSQVSLPNRTRVRDDRHRNTWGNRARFFGRAIGLFALVGFVMSGLSLSDVLTTAEPFTALRGLLEQPGPATVLSISAWVFVVCAVIVAIFLVMEVLAALTLVALGRTLLGVNTLAQIGFAVALLILVNILSRDNGTRFDLTRDGRFTLSENMLADLKRLRADKPTTIVVLRQSKPGGLLTEQADAYDNAAEEKVVEKVNDLVGQLRAFGPRFNVVILDTKETGFDRELRDLARRRPGLSQAITAAPENSIFFYADEKVQSKSRAEGTRLTGTANLGARPAVLTDPDDADKSLVYPGTIARLAFRDFYQLDKTASKEATTTERERAGAVTGGVAFGPGALGAGNLVLIPRGPEVFVRKLLTLEERKPRVGLAVIHPLLTSRDNNDDYSSSGLRTALERNGFEVTDIILKKWSRSGPPTPAATTYEESELDRGEARYNLLTLAVANREALISQLSGSLTKIEAALAKSDAATELDEKRKRLSEAAAIMQSYVRGRISTETQVREVFTELKIKVEEFRTELAEMQPQLVQAGETYRELLRDERSVESRRTVDVKAKLKAYVDDCDVLIVPRLTVLDIVAGNTIPAPIFNLSKEQAEVVKEFMKEGKPVLFAFGPPLSDARAPGDGPDDIEKLLPQFGVILGRQTILTDDEATAIGERSGQEFGIPIKPTPLVFDIPEVIGKESNPINAAYRTTARAVDRKLELRKGGLRPIDLAPGVAERSSFDPVIVTTGPTSFNEDNPLPADDVAPKYEPSKPDDPKRGTREEERRGPFTVGVALEATVPADWLEAKDVPGAKIIDQEALAALAMPFDGGISAALLSAALDAKPRPKVRVVVYGHGGLFAGKSLDSAQETLVVNSLNWQLKRDERLPVNKPDSEKWHYPRVDLAPSAARLWRQGLLLVLPSCAVVIGITVLMLRRVR